MSNNQQQKPTFTIVEVTGDILNLRLEGVLHVHFIDMGAVANTGNQLQDAANSGKRKNHVIFQFDIHKDDQTETWRTIHLSMDMDMNLQDVASDEAQAPQSIRSSLSSRSSFNDIEERPVTVPPSIASAGSDHADAVEAPANGSDASSLTGNASYSYDIEPSSQSGGGADIIEGAPAPGQLYIKVRDYGEPFSTLKSFSFALKGTPQLWRFVEAIASRDMQLFSFRKLNFSFFGCRDFMFVHSILKKSERTADSTGSSVAFNRTTGLSKRTSSTNFALKIMISLFTTSSAGAILRSRPKASTASVTATPPGLRIP